ncbi:MAG TPA: transcriptional regulator [Ruminococcaceae bacterium]|nr:transcriptional regulator [Oscillospiraceae bacterium]
MNEAICQSCGMPIEDKKLRGTEKDGSQSSEYCCYCYRNGLFVKSETLEEMIESCIPFMMEDGSCKSEEEARSSLLKVLPNLKRWKQT